MSLGFVDSLARGSTRRKGSISGGRIRTSFLMRYVLERDEGTDVPDEGTDIRDYGMILDEAHTRSQGHIRVS